VKKKINKNKKEEEEKKKKKLIKKKKKEEVLRVYVVQWPGYMEGSEDLSRYCLSRLKMADRNEPVLAHVNALEIAEFVDGVDR
jgi:cadmium resistance protein CadD (predicted permease)